MISKLLQKGLNSTFQKFNLITREEFDIQTEVLAKTRQTLAQLEHRLTELEQLIQSNAEL